VLIRADRTTGLSSKKDKIGFWIESRRAGYILECPVDGIKHPEAEAGYKYESVD
jgi:hypothetical protein